MKWIFTGEPRGVPARLFSVEQVTLIHQHMLHTLEAPEEIQVPVAAPELAVRHAQKPSRLFLTHQFDDFLVLGFFQFRRCDFPSRKARPRLFDSHRV